MKTNRIMAITIYLMNKKRVTTNELSKRFEVSTRTIKRDIEDLIIAGIPIVSIKGKGGGYELLEGFTLEKNLINKSEGLVLKELLNSISKVIGDKDYLSLNEKVKGLSNKKESPIAIDINPYSSEESMGDIKKIKKAIEEKKIIEFDYINNKGEEARRKIEPNKLRLRGNNWYLEGYCILKKGDRVFRLARLKNLHVTTFTFLERVVEKKICEEFRKEVSLILDFEPESYHRLDYYFPTETISKGENGKYRVEVTYPEDEWIYSMLLSFGPLVDIISPKRLVDIVYERALATVKKIDKKRSRS